MAIDAQSVLDSFATGETTTEQPRSDFANQVLQSFETEPEPIQAPVEGIPESPREEVVSPDLSQQLEQQELERQEEARQQQETFGRSAARFGGLGLEEEAQPRDPLSALPEFEAKEAGLGQQLKAAVGMLSTMDPEEQVKIVQAQIPEAKITRDTEGNYIARLGDEVGFINKPGPSLSDASTFAAQLAAFIPQGKIASLAPTLAQRATVGAVGAGATDVALQEITKAAGGKEQTDIGQVGLTSLLGGLGEVAVPVFTNLYKRFSGTDKVPDRFFNEAGEPTEEAVDTLKKLGVDLDDFSEEARKFARQDVLPTEVGEDVLRRAEGQASGVDLTRAGVTAEEGQIQLERQLAGQEPQFQDIRRTQQEQLLEEGRRIQTEAGGEIFSSLENLKRGTGERIQKALRGREAEELAIVSDGYESAKASAGADAKVPTSTITQFFKSDTINNLRDLVPEIATVEKVLKNSGGIIRKPPTPKRFERPKPKPKAKNFTVNDAEIMNQFINSITPVAGENAKRTQLIMGKIKGIINDSVSRVDGVGSEAADHFLNARRLRTKVAKEFQARDEIQQLVGFKPGTETNVLEPSQIFDSLVKFGNAPSKIESLKRVKASLLKSGNDGRAAFNDIGSTTIAELLERSMKDKTFNPKVFNTGLNNIGRESLNTLVGKDATRELFRLGRVAKGVDFRTLQGGDFTGKARGFLNSFLRVARLNPLAGGIRTGVGSVLLQTGLTSADKLGKAQALKLAKDALPRLNQEIIEETAREARKNFPNLVLALGIVSGRKEDEE